MIYDQLRDYCDCVKNVTDADIDELIGLISMYTCWTNKPCDTFLKGDREQVVQLPDCLCDCDVFEFEPLYDPFEPDSFEFTLVTQQGIEETTTAISNYRYSEIDRKFKMELPIPNCKCKTECGCPTKYKLLVRYVAGYEELPECLRPIFCEGLQYIVERKKCDCSDCQTCAEDKYGDPEAGKRLIYGANTLTEQLKVFFMETLTAQYTRQLSLISLCGRKNDKIWGFVV